VTRPDGSVWQIPGKVDRLAVDGDNVIVADFKSGSPPASGGTPKAYIRQLALYRLALAPLWPGKRLRMLLIWTGGPVVQELGEALLDQAAAEAIEA
jgi:ATP-dependent helicase/nuclease subunit A